MSRTLGVRTRLLLAVAFVFAVATTALLAAFNLLLADRLSANATATARARAEAQVGALKVRNGRIILNEGPEGGGIGALIWIFDARGHVLEAPPDGEDLRDSAVSLARSGNRNANDGASGARLYAAPVLANGTQAGTVVAAVSTKPYDETRNTALVGSIALGGLLLLVTALATRWILRAAFRPVTTMTASAAAWSESEPERRFQLGEPHDELTELAATFDALLTRVTSSLRREQRFAAELSHELRTPLARISAEAELALNHPRSPDEYRDAIDLVWRDTRQMSRTVEGLVAAARHEAGLTRQTSDARDAVTRAVHTADPLAEAKGIEIVSTLPKAPIRVPMDAGLVEQMLQPLLENACHYGRTRVEVDARTNGDTATIAVRDDGPGITADERDAIFEPGRRGSAGQERPAGSGLGLALALRLAQSAGGRIRVEKTGSGAGFLLELPLA